MNKRKVLNLKKMMSGVSVRTLRAKIAGKKTQLHVAEGKNTHSLVIVKDKKGQFFLTKASDHSIKIPTTPDEIIALTGNVAAGNFSSILLK